MSDAEEGKRAEREAEGSKIVSSNNQTEDRRKFEEEFSRWIAEMEEQMESTRRSEQLTQEDFAVRINAQEF